jgi:predicted transcriptional regulator YdeE
LEPAESRISPNLEQFADRIGLIVGLQANGKVSQEEAYEQIKELWKTLKISRNDLLPNNNDKI